MIGRKKSGFLLGGVLYHTNSRHAETCHWSDTGTKPMGQPGGLGGLRSLIGSTYE